MPSWLPQNIQKRVFHYVLNKLAVFSNLDLDKLNVSLGTTSQLAVHDVLIDTDRINIPGVFVRDGQIQDLEISLGVGGVQIKGDEINLTVALSRADPTDDITEDIAALLSRTTADIAESIVKDEDGTDDGFGLGDYSGVVSKMVDAALSQLVVQLSNVKIRAILDDSTTTDIVVKKCELSTTDGLRNLKLHEIDFSLITIPDDGTESEADDDGDSDDDQLMQSAVFSHEQASTMYLSAMQSVTPRDLLEIKTKILDIDTVSLSFRGVALNGLSIDIGIVQLALEHLPVVLKPLLEFSSKYAVSPSVISESIIEDDEPGFSWSELKVDQISAGFTDTVRLIIDKVTATNNEDESILVEAHRLYINENDAKLLWFESDDGENRADLTCKLDEQSVRVLVPNTGIFDFHLKSLIPVVETLNAFSGLLDSKSNLADSDQLPKKVTAQTNRFWGEIHCGSNNVDVSILPISLENDVLKVGDCKLSFDETEMMEIKALAFEFNSARKTVINQPDSTELMAAINSQLTIDYIKTSLTESKVMELVNDIQLLPGLTKPHPEVVKRTRRLRLEDSVKLSIVIRGADCTFNTTNAGTFDLDVRNIECHFLDSNTIQTSIYSVHLSRDFSDIDSSVSHISLLHNANPHKKEKPMIYFELDDKGSPTQLRLWNVAVEYHVRLLKLLENLASSDDGDDDDSEPNLADSLATVTFSELKFPIFLTDCVVGLSPLNLPSRGQLVIRDAGCAFKKVNNDIYLDLTIRKATLMMIDDVQYLESITGDLSSTRSRGRGPVLDQVLSFAQQGYVSVARLSSVVSQIAINEQSTESKIRIDVSSELLHLETCADSTQTLMQVLNGLKPPIEGGEEIKYKTEVMPLNVLEGIEDGTFNDIAQQQALVEKYSDDSTADFMADDIPSNIDFVESFYADKSSKSQWAHSSSGGNSVNGNQEYSRADLLLDQDLSVLATGKAGVEPYDPANQRRAAVFEQRAREHEQLLGFDEDHFAQPQSSSGSDDGSNSGSDEGPPLLIVNGESPSAKKITPIVLIYLKDSMFTWNLHDGYDWIHTQDTIKRAIKRVEVEAGQTRIERSVAAVNANQEEGEDGEADVGGDEVVHDMLFNSIYIGIPTDRDPTELRRAINRELYYDDASETASVSTVTQSRSSSRSPLGINNRRSSHGQKLKLKRSKKHKVRIELSGVTADVTVYAGVNDTPSTIAHVKGEDGQLLNRVDLRVRDVEIIDNVPTSTWNKFFSYMRSAGERESDSSMAHIMIDTVKPIPDVATSEMIMNISVLPVRLHVDQDTLDFLTRFFEFKDERFIDEAVEDEIMFIQKFDIRAVKVKLDYKPKKVDYAGLKSGHVTEFMNFFILDEAEMVLRRIILYGVPGFPRLAQLLHNTWMPDIRSTQLGDVLAGIAPVRSLLRLGSGMKDLVAVPVREYKKDGRLVRSLQKGAVTFARTTTNEIVRFGAKLAAGTQTLLENADQALGGAGAASRLNHVSKKQQHISPYSDDVAAFEAVSEEEYDDLHHSEEDADNDGTAAGQFRKPPAVSLYANQPTGINQGLKVAYNSLGHNLAIARDAVYNISADAADHGGNAGDAAAAVARAAPIAIIRPMIGATEAVSKTLLGVANQMDPKQMADVEEKYKQGK